MEWDPGRLRESKWRARDVGNRGGGMEQSAGEAGGGRRWREDHFTNTEKFRGLAVN